MTFSLSEVRKVATRPERIVPHCADGALVAEHQRLVAEFEAAQRSGGAGRLGGDPAAALARQVADVEARMREATFPFRFRALQAHEWRALQDGHPDPEGKRLFNVDTFPTAAILACCVEPADLDREYLDGLSGAQLSELFDGAWEVNSTAPKETTHFGASAALATSATTSDTAPPAGSRGRSSSAG